jgi:hypothetical protein
LSGSVLFSSIVQNPSHNRVTEDTESLKTTCLLYLYW